MNEFQGDLANINVLKERRKKFNCNTLYSSFVSNPRPFNSILYSPILLVTFHKDNQIPELSSLFSFKTPPCSTTGGMTVGLLGISIKIQGETSHLIVFRVSNLLNRKMKAKEESNAINY